MDRGDTPNLFFPLLALLAIVFPFAISYRMPASSGGNNVSSQAVEQKVTTEAAEPGAKTKPHTAARLIEEFFHARSDRSTWSEKDPRNEYSLDFMIAIVADPIDSRLTHMFDSSIDSIQRAFEADDWELDRFDLAWSEPASAKQDEKTAKGSKVEAEPEPPRYRREPSLLLFRKPGEKKLFLVFLVGETPTSGLHKDAMASVLLQLADFFPKEPGHKALPSKLQSSAEHYPKGPLTIKIMGPSYSGSATSLEFALRDWLAGLSAEVRKRVEFRIISGSATAIHPQEFCKIHAGGPQTFQAVVPSDEIAMPVIRAYIRSLGRWGSYKRIAMLTEAGTAYGQQAIMPHGISSVSERAKEKTDAGCLQQSSQKNEGSVTCETDESAVINLPFPLHISQLRTESEKQRQSQQKAASEAISNPAQSLHLNAQEASQPRETPPSFSDLGAPSSELVLSRLLATISHEGIYAVGILATDIRDITFLSREIHQHCPGTLVFAVVSDMLFSHPDVGLAARGMLVFTPYPLYNLNQTWTPPYRGLRSRVQFPSQDAEGVYNATLALLDRDDLLLDYGQPFSSQGTTQTDETAKPTLWVTVVGRNGPLPVTTLKWTDPENYAWTADRAQCKSPTLDEEGIYSAGSTLMMVLLGALLFAFSFSVIREYHSLASRKPGRASGWISLVFGEPATVEYRRQACLFLLASLVSLLSFYLLVVALYALPVLASWHLGHLPAFTPEHWHWRMVRVLAAIPIVAGLVSLTAAVVEVACAFWTAPGQKKVLRVGVQVIILSGCALVLFILAPRFAGEWLSAAREGLPEAFFAYVRAFELNSGLSPLVPLFCVSLAGFLWGFCAFRRLRMIDGIRSTAGEHHEEELFLCVETGSFGGLRCLEESVRERLEGATAFSPAWYRILVGIGLATALYLFLCPFVPSYEGLRFYFLFGWGFFLGYSALASEVGRLCLAWTAFRHLLQRLAVHPMQEAYGRYREKFKGLSRIDLAMPGQIFPVLSFSVNQAERMLRMAQSRVSSGNLGPMQRQNLELWILEAERAVPKAAKNLSQALTADAKRQWELAVVGRSQSQRALGRLAQETALLLEPSWRAEKDNPPLPEGEFKDFRELGEEFLAGRTVLLISYVLPALRKLGTFILIGLLLMLFSVMFYPFVQKNHFLAFNWIVILAFVGLALLVTVQVERDVVLSALNDTKAGQVKMTRQFTFRILAYVMVPILALLSAQFPDTLGQVISWLSVFQGH